jgi:hypothetical protein
MKVNHRTVLARHLSAAVVLALAVVCIGATPSSAAPTVPNDPNAKGFIGLCDSQDRNVTGGNVDTAPFVWKAIASIPPPKQFLGRGENAVLDIFQPRPGVEPAEWSGDQLTAATFYTARRAPSTQATLKDIPLSVVVSEFPALVDGLYQLRMYFGRTNVGIYSATYPATFIRVTGDRWSVVSGGRVNCGAASGNSTEVLTGAMSPKEAYGIAPPRPAHGRASSSPSRAAEPAGGPVGRSDARGGGQSPVGNRSTYGATQPDAAPAAKTGSSPGAAGWWAALVASAVAAMAGLGWWRTRRRSSYEKAEPEDAFA